MLYVCCTYYFRASLDHVFFPSVTLCNINQGRRSFFLAHGLQNDSKTLKAVLGQAYFGVTPELVSLTWMLTNTEFYLN